jgi:MipA family protein
MNKLTAILLTCGLAACGTVSAADTDPDRLLIVGAGIGVTPEYVGGEKSRAGLATLIQMRRGRFSFDDGLHYDAVQTNSGTLSLGLSYDDGRRDYRPRRAGTMGSDYLQGMGRIDGAATIDVQVTQQVGVWELSGAVKRWVGDESFLTAEFGALLTLPAAGGVSLAVGAYADWGNASYVQSHFGVTAEQAASSDFSVWSPRAQVHSARLVAQAAYALTPRWLVVGTISGDRLLGAAGDSPIVQQRNGLAGTLVMAYRFH